MLGVGARTQKRIMQTESDKNDADSIRTTFQGEIRLRSYSITWVSLKEGYISRI